MNRNTNAHFSTVPSINHPRSQFDRSFSHTTSFDFGDCVPILLEECLPGDTVELRTSKIIRLQTLLAPVYTNMYLDVYYFFVPNRLVWDHWKEFMGENTQSAWLPSVTYTVPKTSTNGPTFKNSIVDYFGLPVGSTWRSDNINAPIALPFRAYGLIMNDYFRSEALTDPLNVVTSDAPLTLGLGPEAGGRPFKAAKFHDYYTSGLPSPQRGPQVNILGNMSGAIPVVAGSYHNTMPITVGGSSYMVPEAYAMHQNPGDTSYTTLGALHRNSGLTYSMGTPTNVNNTPYFTDDSGLQPNNLWANTNVPGASGSLSVSINDLRLATVTQMYYEALARAGSRYEEQIQQFFGVSNPDSRIQHPEYLGGNRVQINVHEVTNTAQSEQDFLGDVGARSVTADSHNDFVHSFTEHGWLMGIAVARYDHAYSEGIARKWLRSDKFDYYNPLFSRIGEQPIYDVELYSYGKLDSRSVFAYQEAWASYRYAENMVSGEIRPSVTGNLSHWTAADRYTSTPVLSDGWIREDKTNIDRILAVTSANANQVFADFYFQAKWSRCMPMYSVPGAIGQF